MRKVALDSNIIAHILRGNTGGIGEKIDKIDRYFIPFAVYGEVLAGIKAGGNPPRYLAVFDEFMNEDYVETSNEPACVIAGFYADIYTYLKKQGTPVSPNDLWIAAECASQGLPLFTLDSDFERIPHVLKF